jgi:hypothetical protein
MCSSGRPNCKSRDSEDEQPKAAPIKPDVIIDAPKKKGGRPKKY